MNVNLAIIKNDGCFESLLLLPLFLTQFSIQPVKELDTMMMLKLCSKN